MTKAERYIELVADENGHLCDQHALRAIEIAIEETKQQITKNAVHAIVDYPFIGHDFPNIYPNYKELKDYCDKNGIKDNDKVKLIIIKDKLV